MNEDIDEVADIELVQVSAESIKTRKEKESRIKNMLVQATRAHELFAQSFWESNLRTKGKILFPCDHDASDSNEE